MSKKHPFVEGVLKGQFGFLLLSFALMFLVLPLTPVDRLFLDKIISVFSFVVLFSCLRAITSNRKFLIFMVVLSLLNLVVGSTELLSEVETHEFQTFVLGVRLLYYLLIFGSIMGYVLDRSPVTGNKIAGAVSAYLIMGLLWSVIYALFYHLNPESFVVPEHLRGDNIMELWQVYFSFTTLTSLGYGDITPRFHAVQSYAVMEAACGQIFLTVLVSRLVALQIIYSQSITDAKGAESAE